MFSAIGQPFLVNAPTKLAAVWFGQNERVIAVTIAVAAQAFGAAVGFVLPSLFVSPTDEGDEFRSHVEWSLITQAIMGVCMFLICLVFFREKPKTPPTATAFALLDQPGNFGSSITGLLTNKDMIFLCLAFGGI